MGYYILGIVAILVATLSAFAGTSCVTTPSNRECHQACNTCSADTCSNNCITCPATLYGTDCNRTCPAHCKDGRCELLSNGRSVNCTMGCQAGYRGLTCKTDCKRPCLTCDRYTGRCTGPCRAGFYGGECLRRCLYPCNRCNKGSGRCLDPCENGFYGSNCSQRCSRACYRCNKESGECTGHCNNGYYGETCTKIQLSDAQARDSVAMSITTEVQDEKSKPHTTTEDSASGETNVTVEDDNETAFPSIDENHKKRSVTNVAVTERDSDHVYDEIGPPTVQPNTVAPPDIEAGYLTPTRPNTESSYLTPTMPNPYTVSIVTVPPDNGAGYLTPTKPNTDSGSIVTAPPDTEAGYLTATQPNTETRYLTLSQSNTETRYLTLAQPNTDTGSMVTALSDTGAGYFTTV